MNRAYAGVVLVVEDDEDSRETLRELLELSGYEVQVAANGAEALERLAALHDRGCVMLLDLYMPVMNGWEVVQRLSHAPPRLHVIVTTSAPDDAPPGLPVLSKPLRLDTVLSRLQAVTN